MTQMTFNVPDISCDHCKTSIEGAVAALAGVEAVTVHIEPKTVDVSFSPPVEVDEIVAAIEGQGYEVAGV